MLTCRHLCCAASASALISFTATNAAAEECMIVTPDRQASFTPDQALVELKSGNQRFISGQARNCDLLSQVRATASTQAPFAVVLGCIDSRVPPELVFDQRIGDIFAARVAGNIVNADILGSLEFATKLAGAKLILVLGHSNCGAIKGAIDRAELGELTQLLAKIEPAILAVPGERTSNDKTYVQAVAEQNVKFVMRELAANKTLGELVASGAIRIAGAMHDLSTGEVSFLS